MLSTKLQILMPMGGLGSRFTKAGYTIPKPLIEVDGKPMFMRALDSFAHINDVQHIFVIRKEHDERFDLSHHISQELPNAKIAILDHDTRGAVESCLAASDYIDDGLPITIADCDIYFESKPYFDNIATAEKLGSPDGILLTFQSGDPRYSYAEIDKAGTVLKTAEKKVISQHAILGGYFFRKGKIFKSLAQNFTRSSLPDNLKEYYVSHLFNLLIADGGRVKIAEVERQYIFGTPEELEAYLSLKVNLG